MSIITGNIWEDLEKFVWTKQSKSPYVSTALVEAFLLFLLLILSEYNYKKAKNISSNQIGIFKKS